MARRLAVFTKNDVNPAYFGARLGAERVARQHGFAIRHYVPRCPDNVSQQRELLASAIRDRPDAILLNPAHPTALNDYVREAARQRIPVLTFINEVDGESVTTFIGADDRALGFELARYLSHYLPAPCGLVIVNGPEAATTARMRAEGFRNALARFAPDAIVHEINALYQREMARVGVARLIASGVRSDGVLAANDLMALGALDALDVAGRVASVVGINALPEAVASIAKGKMLATASFDAMAMACIATEAAIRHLDGEFVPKRIVLPVEIVDMSNCAAWNRAYEERECLSWESAIVQNRSDSPT